MFCNDASPSAAGASLLSALSSGAVVSSSDTAADVSSALDEDALSVELSLPALEQAHEIDFCQFH
jgi:hypothetical protein